jgi:hypothetical protein
MTTKPKPEDDEFWSRDAIVARITSPRPRPVDAEKAGPMRIWEARQSAQQALELLVELERREAERWRGSDEARYLAQEAVAARLDAEQQIAKWWGV